MDENIQIKRNPMFFFNLKIENLTFIWSRPEDIKSFPDIDVDSETHPNENALVASREELEYLNARSHWMSAIYESSSWYNGLDENKLV